MQQAAIYCRVSTDGQEDNSSLEDQERLCREYAAGRNYLVADVYQDVHSAFDLWERPHLTRLREAMRRGEIDALICLDPDRLSRKQTHTAILADECDRHGVDLLFVAVEFDKTATGEYLRATRAFIAELEREKIRERTMRGKAARLRSGRLVPSGRPLYGYRWADETRSRYAIGETTAPIARRIFELAAAGVPLRAIAQQMTDEGVPTANGAARWFHSVIRSMLRHGNYSGGPAGGRIAA